MKRFLLILILAVLLIFPATVLAQCSVHNNDKDGCLGDPSGGCVWNPVEDRCYGVSVVDPDNLFDLIDMAVWWVFAFVMAVALIFLFLSGYNFITAQGDETKIKKARTMLVYALIGVGVAIGARGLVMLVQAILESS